MSPDEPAAPTTPTTDDQGSGGGAEPPAGDPPADPAPAEPKEGEEPKGDEPSAPEPLTAEAIKIPEGFEVDDKSLGSFLEVMNNGDLSPAERAQALVDLQADVMKAASERNSALWQETQEKWQAEVQADPEVGGDKVGPTLAGISKLVDQYAADPQALRDVFDLTGMGNNLQMVKFLNAMAKDLGVEGEPVSGGPPSGSRSAADILYGNQGK